MTDRCTRQESSTEARIGWIELEHRHIAREVLEDGVAQEKCRARPACRGSHAVHE